MLAMLIPMLTTNLQSPDWLIVEASILAIGAVANGAFILMTAMLPELVPFLLQCAQHEQTLVRTMAVWSLARYSSWIVSQRDHTAFFEPVLVRVRVAAGAVDAATLVRRTHSCV